MVTTSDGSGSVMSNRTGRLDAGPKDHAPSPAANALYMHGDCVLRITAAVLLVVMRCRISH
jgi:hypothetical protein